MSEGADHYVSVFPCHTIDAPSRQPIGCDRARTRTEQPGWVGGVAQLSGGIAGVYLKEEET